MTDDFEDSLLERFRSGDMNAFARLVTRHQGALLRHAEGLLGPGGGRSGGAEDVVQEAFLRLAQSPPEIGSDGEPNGRLASWLHTVTRNLCMDVLRSETRRKQREESVAAAEAVGGGHSRVEANDTRAAVEQKLAVLPLEQREVLVLRLLGDKSYKEIAAITGKKIGTVGWLVSVGLKALSTELAPLLDGSRSTQSPARGEAS